MTYPDRVRIVEVGPRDGLQNEAQAIGAEHKVAFIDALASSGLAEIEATSFVHPRAIPQLADAEAVWSGLTPHDGVRYSALVPNERGLDRALACGVSRIAVFTAASETFAQRNINASIDESLARFDPVMRRAREAGITVRGYVSTCFDCPYEGRVDVERVVEVTRALLDLGADEVAVSDTIGAAAPTDVRRVLERVLSEVEAQRIALHLHDTYGTALANVCAGMEMGITTFDASAGGLGGCPYAPGAAGNLATEDLVYLLDRMGIETGVRLEAVFRASLGMARAMRRDTMPSKQFQRLSGRCT